MSEDAKVCLFWLSYIAVAFIAFGFVIGKLMWGPAEIFISAFVAVFWPASGLIWLGVWLA